MDGWALSQGFEYKNHYYLLEWRNCNNTDASMQYCYNYTNVDLGVVEYFRYEPGMLLWYRDTGYTDNWVGVHPGHGVLSVVDFHAEPVIVEGTDARSTIQILSGMRKHQVPESLFPDTE